MRKIFYLSIISMIALLVISKGVFGYEITKEATSMIGNIQSMIFTDDGTPSGNVKVRISGEEGMIYGSGGIWIGKGGGNGIYSNGSNVGIGTTDLSNKLNVGGDMMIRDVNKLKIGNEYIQGNGTVMNIISQGVVNMEGVRNYIRGGVVTFGSTWYDENDSSYYMDLNNETTLNNLTAKNILIGSGGAGNAELNLKSGSLGHWGIYHDGVSEELRMWNGGMNRISIGKGGEIYTNNSILINGDKRWRGKIMPISKGGTGLSGCNDDQILIWRSGKWVCEFTYDADPEPFAFTNLTKKGLNIVVESNSIIPVGYYKSIVSVTGEGNPQVSCNNGAWSTSCRITKGESVKVRLTTANDYLVTRGATIKIGTITSQWTVKTAPMSKLNCKAWYDAGYTTNGEYSIDPDGSGPIDIAYLYCNMSGGQRALVVGIDINNTNHINAGEVTPENLNTINGKGKVSDVFINALQNIGRKQLVLESIPGWAHALGTVPEGFSSNSVAWLFNVCNFASDVAPATVGGTPNCINAGYWASGPARGMGFDGPNRWGGFYGVPGWGGLYEAWVDSNYRHYAGRLWAR